MTVEDAAAELYAGSPADFVRRRTELAAAARERGERDVAAEITGLRKPTIGAWLANLLVRERRDQVEELVALGEALREAQGVLDAEQLRELGKQRYRIVRRLVGQAGLRASELGQVPGASADEELEATLTAALADPVAAHQLLTGQLSRGLTYAGLGFGASATAAGTPRPGSSKSTKPRSVSAAKRPTGADDGSTAAARAAELDAAERDLAQARLQAAAAAADAENVQARSEQAQDALATAREQLEQASAELARAQAAVAAAQAEADASDAVRADAVKEAAAAGVRADHSERSLQAVRSA